jgi:hypothetical protein
MMRKLFAPAAAASLLTTALAAGVAPAGAAAPAKPSLSVSKSSVTAGDSVEFTGRLVRGKMNQKAVLQVWRAGKWSKLDSDYTNRQGKFEMEVELDEPGSYRFRVLGKKSRLYEVPELVTPKVRVRVAVRPGSMDAPWQPGQWFSIADWRFAFNSTVTDAWPVKQSQSPSAEPPPPGWAYVAVEFGYQYTGAGSDQPWGDNSLNFVGSDGVVYTGYATVNGHEYYCSLDNDWLYAPEVYTGGSASASECNVVPQAVIAGGKWRMSNYDADDQFVTIS